MKNSLKSIVFVFYTVSVHRQGGKEAELGGTVWIPLHKELEASDLPDFTIDSVCELPEVLPNSPRMKRLTNADQALLVAR